MLLEGDPLIVADGDGMSLLVAPLGLSVLIGDDEGRISGDGVEGDNDNDAVG